ncbi:MAG: SusC/RagA family TonB-linked outer membrane protein [Bacteroidota bacterium]|nr:SusC/RagA family TonB-linked outer membrane protein [Bacteroidota bacterium]
MKKLTGLIKTLLIGFLFSGATGAAAQSSQIRGTVLDERGNPMEGVSVIARPGNNDAGPDATGTTNKEGTFSLAGLKIAVSYNLYFSHVGYEQYIEKNVVIKNDMSALLIRMNRKDSALDQVVVIGYGEVKQKDVTGSITTIKSDDLNKGVINNPILALQGKVPGLNISKDGSPYGGASIILRGPSTIREGAAQQPFIVVDGMPNSIIPPIDDVASIDILKDASATAIYGARGANGVIIITTKSGKANAQEISYNSFVALETISNKIEMLNADEYRAYINKNGLSLSPDDEHHVNTNWMNEITRNGISYRNNVSLSGGSNRTQYNSSIEHFKNEGIIKGTSLERLTIRGRLQQSALNNKLKILINVGAVLTNIQALIDQRSILWNALVFQPTRKVQDENGNYLERINDPLNPVALIMQHKNDTKIRELFGNFGLEYKVLPDLKYVINTSLNSTQNTNSVYYSKLSRLKQGSNGEADRSTYESGSKLLETYLSYDKKIGAHSIGLLAGYSWQEDQSGDGFQSSNINFITDGVGYYNLGLGSGATGYVPSYGTTAMTTLRQISGYARVKYEYANKYLFQATVRRDGSSAFGKNNRWGTFPSASIGWRLNEEKFLKHLSLFDDLKLRIGYGISGNSIGFDPLISVLRYGTSGTFYQAGQYVVGITPVQNENPDLKWESTSVLNTGIDFSVLKGRLRGTIEYYNKKTNDLIWTYSVPPTQYYVNTLTTNVGKMENKGWEFLIQGIPVKNRRLEWNSSFTLSFNTNRIVSLSNDIFKLESVDYYGVGMHGQSGNLAFRLQAGYPVGQFALWEYAGENSQGISQFADKNGNLTVSPASSDRKITKQNAQPKAIGGWYNTIRYHQFSLEFLLRGTFGNTILNATRADLNYPAEILRYNVSKETLNESVKNTTANYTSTRYLEKGDYLRLDNITLSYSPELKSQAFRKLRLYATVNNAFIITGYKGIDPEVNIGGLSPGIDDSNIYPKTRSFVFGMNVSIN